MAMKHFWFEDDFIAFLLSLKVPTKRNDKSLEKTLKNEKTRFINSYSQMLSQKCYRRYSDDFYARLGRATKGIKRNFNSLIRIVQAYDKQEFALAESLFDQMMDELYPHLLALDLYFPHFPSPLYRIRESKDKELKQPKDLFHISYRLRHLASNERYSLAGHPCLYLSSDLHIAWQECGYPHRFYYSVYKYNEPPESTNTWKYITFLSPWWIANHKFRAINPPEESYSAFARDYLLTYPLMFACSIVNPNGHSSFKPEYVIPQMLTQWVYRSDGIRGIRYFSCHKNEEDMRYLGFNVVLPAKNCSSRGYSKDLVEKFRVSKPIHYVACLPEQKASAVEKCKEELLLATGVLPLYASNAIFEMYRVADLLDKTIKNWENTNIPLVISALTTTISCGELLREKYKKDIVKNQSIEFDSPDSLLNNLDKYDIYYDRFKTEIIDIARNYLEVLRQSSLPTVKDYYKI